MIIADIEKHIQGHRSITLVDAVKGIHAMQRVLPKQLWDELYLETLTGIIHDAMDNAVCREAGIDRCSYPWCYELESAAFGLNITYCSSTLCTARAKEVVEETGAYKHTVFHSRYVKVGTVCEHCLRVFNGAEWELLTDLQKESLKAKLS
jgi:hypothetical protein